MVLKDLMSLTEYGKYRKARGLPGATTQSVLNAVNSGRIPVVLVGKNRMVNPAAADQAWLLNTDQGRYTTEQYAAANRIEPPPTLDREAIQAAMLGLTLDNAAILAGGLSHDLNLDPVTALRAAALGLFRLLAVVAEITKCQAWETAVMPAWAGPLLAGQFDDPALLDVLDTVDAVAGDLAGADEVAEDE